MIGRHTIPQQPGHSSRSRGTTAGYFFAGSHFLVSTCSRAGFISYQATADELDRGATVIALLKLLRDSTYVVTRRFCSMTSTKLNYSRSRSVLTFRSDENRRTTVCCLSEGRVVVAFLCIMFWVALETFERNLIWSMKQSLFGLDGKKTLFAFIVDWGSSGLSGRSSTSRLSQGSRESRMSTEIGIS